MTSTDGSASMAWATRPPQKAPRPVTRTRLPTPLPEPDRLTVAQHVVERLLDQLTYPLRLVHYQAPRVPGPIGLHVEGDRVEHADADLAGQVEDHAEGPQAAEGDHVRGDGEVRQAEALGQRSEERRVGKECGCTGR